MKPEQIAVGNRYVWTGLDDGTPTVVTVSDLDTGEHGTAAPCVGLTQDGTGQEFTSLLTDFAAAATAAAPWDCEAYGVEGTAFGALCFFMGDLHERLCGTAAECAGRMIAERGRVFERIGDLAAAGDPTGLYLAGEFDSPERLLGGRQDDPEEGSPS